MASEKVEYVLGLKDLFSASIKDAEKAAMGLEKKVNSASLSLGGLAKAAGGLFALSAIKDFGMGVVETGAKFEQYEMGLATLLKSTTAAHEVFENIKKDAMSTPFETEPLVMANRALISAGVSAKDARTDVLGLANAIAATGGGNDELSRMAVNMQQIKNTGKATALDIKQFAYAGINIYGLLADATGKTTDQVKGMSVSYDLLSMALNKAAGAGGIYEDGLNKLSHTTAGQISNLADAWTFFKVDIFKELKPMIDSSIVSLSGFIHSLKDGIVWIKAHWEGVRNIATAVGSLAAAMLLYNGYAAIANIQIGGMTLKFIAQWAATVGLKTAWADLNSTMLLTPTGALIAGLATLIWMLNDVYHQYEKLQEIREKARVDKRNSPYRAEIEDLKELSKVIQKKNKISKEEADLKALAVESKFYDGKIKEQEGLLFKMKLGTKEAQDAAANLFELRLRKKALRDTGAYNAATKGATGATGGMGKSASDVTGVKPTNIYINIAKFQDKIEVNVQKLDEAIGMVEEKLSKMLLTVVNDANIIGQQ
jgi:tape measure domain-containing protein